MSVHLLLAISLEVISLIELVQVKAMKVGFRLPYFWSLATALKCQNCLLIFLQINIMNTGTLKLFVTLTSSGVGSIRPRQWTANIYEEHWSVYWFCADECNINTTEGISCRVEHCFQAYFIKCQAHLTRNGIIYA